LQIRPVVVGSEKRYYDKVFGLELLCAKAVAGSLSIEGRSLLIREAKKLPSSD
jgi:hypothetical protein